MEMTEGSRSGAVLQGGNLEARQEAARIMGGVTSEAKTRAARENGKRGGRPKGIPASAETRRKLSEAKRKRDAERKAKGDNDE